MEIRLTLLDPRRFGARVDVVIDAPAGALFSVSDQRVTALGAGRMLALGPTATPARVLRMRYTADC